MKAFFSRKVPFYLLAKGEVTDSIGFDAYPVEVPQAVIEFAQNARAITNEMELFFSNSPTPEECAQASADLLTALVRENNYGEE